MSLLLVSRRGQKPKNSQGKPRQTSGTSQPCSLVGLKRKREISKRGGGIGRKIEDSNGFGEKKKNEQNE